MLVIAFKSSNGDIIVTFLLSLSVNLFCVSTRASFVSALRLPSVPPSICPSIHVQYTSLGVIIVSKKANVFCLQNGTHYFSLSTSCQNYSLIPHISYFFPPRFFLFLLPLRHIIGFSTCRPSRLCLFFCFCFDIQETSNHFLNMFLEFQNCTVALTRLISMNQPLMAQAQRMTQEAHGRTTITQLETLL